MRQLLMNQCWADLRSVELPRVTASTFMFLGIYTHIRGMFVECIDQHGSYCFLLVAHSDTGFFFRIAFVLLAGCHCGLGEVEV